MKEPGSDIRLSVDPETGRFEAAYYQVRDGVVAETREIEEGRIFADYDEDGMLLGVEVLSLPLPLESSM